MRYNVSTPDEADDWVLYMRQRGRQIWAGPSYTMVDMWRVGQLAGASSQEQTALAYAMFAYWNHVLAHPPLSDRDHHAVARFDEFLCRDGEAGPREQKPTHVLDYARRAKVRAGLGKLRADNERNLGVKQVCTCLKVALPPLVVDRAERLHVLPRHRPRSIPLSDSHRRVHADPRSATAPVIGSGSRSGKTSDSGAM
jgi:hypothetical protein